MKFFIIIIESFILSIFTVFGREITTKGSVNFNSWMLYSKIIGITAIIFGGLYALYEFLSRLEEKKEKCDIKEKNNLVIPQKRNKKIYIGIFLFLIIAWIPVLLAAYPGYFCYDADTQYRFFVNNSITTHHPILHTVILGVLVHGIYLLTGSYNLGILAYSVVQMIASGIVFTYTIYFMEKYKVNRKLQMFGILYFAFFPIISMYVLAATKDIFFSLVGMLLIMKIIDIWHNPDREFTKNKDIVQYMILVMLFCALRNNALIAFIAFIFTFLLFPKKDIKKRLIKYSIIACIIYQIICNIVMIVFNISKGSIREALSVPVQQLAYVYTKDLLTREEDKKIEKMFTTDLFEDYNPQCVDNLKNHFKEKVFLANIPLYLKLGKEHPGSYINAILINSCGFWYPDKVIDGYENKEVIRQKGGKTSLFSPKTNSPGYRCSYIPWLEDVYEKIATYGIVESIPIVSLFFSIGANFWIVLIGIGYSLYKNRYTIAMPLMLIVFLWVTLLFGPMTLVRYLLIVFFGFPLHLSILFNNKKYEKISDNN